MDDITAAGKYKLMAKIIIKYIETIAPSTTATNRYYNSPRQRNQL